LKNVLDASSMAEKRINGEKVLAVINEELKNRRQLVIEGTIDS